MKRCPNLVPCTGSIGKCKGGNGVKHFQRMGNWRQALLRVMGWFHCGWIIALYYATAYRIFQGDAALPGRFWRGLLVVIPFALADLALQFTRKLWEYLLVSVFLCGLAWLLLGTPVAALPVAAVCFFRARNRLSEELVDSLLDHPSLPLLIAVVPPFLYSAAANGPLLQKLCLIWMAVYGLLWCAYRGLKNIEAYLELNRTMSGVPVKRIVLTSGLAVAGMVFLAGALILPVLVMGQGFFRIDPTAPDRGEPQIQLETTGPSMAMGVPQWLEEIGEKNTFQIPPFVGYFFGALVGVGLLIFLLYGVYWVIRGLRGSFVDHRDVVQYLHGPEDQMEEAPSQRRARPALWDRSPNAQVRRKYRRTVLRLSKEAPPSWAAPQEIEERAGLGDSRLHQLYERARYSREGVTSQESRSLKR